MIPAAIVIGAAFAAAPHEGRRDRMKIPPDSVAQTANPVPQTPEVVREGAVLYEKNCLTCHGEKGLGDGPAARFMDKTPADISSPGLGNRLKDGEIYQRISEGRKPMPPFRKKLTEEERWALVHYVKKIGETSKSRDSSR